MCPDIIDNIIPELAPVISKIAHVPSTTLNDTSNVTDSIFAIFQKR